MSEIEKMYENAGIKPYIYCSKPQLDCDARETGNCKQDCEFYSGERLLTPFTAEKQLALIIFLANREIRISPTYISSGYYLNNFSKIKSSRNISTFENSLAQHINALWQDLTEEEKQQVKEILE
jgi:hypothetical protein